MSYDIITSSSKNPKTGSKTISLVDKISFELKNHKVWPLRLQSSDGRTGPFASYVHISVQRRPWGVFETFSKTPTLRLVPVHSRYTDADIQRAIARNLSGDPEATAEDCVDYLDAHMHIMNLERLVPRWKEIHKGRRKYKHSRYYLMNVMDSFMDFVTEDHLNKLLRAADQQLRSSEANLRNITSELRDRLDTDKQVRGQSIGLTRAGRQDQLNLSRIRNVVAPPRPEATPAPAPTPEPAPTPVAAEPKPEPRKTSYERALELSYEERIQNCSHQKTIGRMEELSLQGFWTEFKHCSEDDDKRDYLLKMYGMAVDRYEDLQKERDLVISDGFKMLEEPLPEETGRDILVNTFWAAGEGLTQALNVNAQAQNVYYNELVRINEDSPDLPTPELAYEDHRSMWLGYVIQKLQPRLDAQPTDPLSVLRLNLELEIDILQAELKECLTTQ